MFRDLLQRWRDWTGDKRLDQAIRKELRRLGYGAYTAKTRDVRLAAIQRPGWVQVYRFGVETTADLDKGLEERRRVYLHGLSREDGRKSRIEVLLTEDEEVWRERFEQWSDGLITR